MIDEYSEIALKIIEDYRTVSLSVLYFLPEYSGVIQEFHWQIDDKVPELTRIHKFLNHWYYNIEAEIHEVKIYCGSPMQETTFSHVRYEFPVVWTHNTCNLDELL